MAADFWGAVLGGIGVLLLGLLLYALSKGSSKGVVGDKTPTWFARVFGLFFFSVFVSILLTDIDTNYGLYFWCFLLCLVGAGFVARFTAYFGWYRAAYFIGRINVFRCGRNPVAIDYCRGYLAAKRLKQNEEQREALLWLRSRYHKRNASIYSGEMVMYLIIDSHLTHPHDAEYLATRLSFLQGIGTASIPRAISVLGLKYSLPPALSRSDWSTVQDSARQWDTPANNYLAKYLKRYASFYVVEQTLFSRLRCWLWEKVLWQYRELINFAKRSAEFQKQMSLERSQLSPKELLFANQNSVIDEETREKLIDDLIGDSVKQTWLQRAEELGVRRVDEVWSSVENSVLHFPELKQHSDYIEDDAQYEHIERQQKSIRYVEASIAKKLEEKVGGTALEHFLDWMSILHILNELKASRNEQQVAFTMVYNVIWDWVADLWNIRKEHCLVHFIASVCAPMAYECGINEMGNVLSGITKGDYQ